ncbi:MAG: penicillin-binding protein 1A [Sphingomonas sp.]
MGWFWRRWWGKLLLVLAALPFIGYFALWMTFARGLPSPEALLNYEPALPTYVRDINGEPIQTFARERRVQLAYEEFPRDLINAFLAAEDRTFFSHGGVDLPGIITAMWTNLTNPGRPVGASTITQQVAKNMFLTNEVSYTRKIRELFLARRIESVLSKEQILEIYLNQIFLGRNAYGVQAAARAYFNRDVRELTLPQFAYLAILPKAPANYDPVRHRERALERRNWVLAEMARNNFITQARADAAMRTPLDTIQGGTEEQVRNVGGYFMEEVRRELISRFGETASDEHPNSVYSGGLWVRTSYDPTMQRAAETALLDGLVRFEQGRGWRDPGLTIDIEGEWRGRLAAAPFGAGYPSWREAVVLAIRGGEAQLGFADGTRGRLPSANASMPRRGGGGPAFSALRPGAIIAVERQGESGDIYSIRSIPEISGAIIAEEVGTGRVRAMQGGFDARLSDFNRATQAQRQPGSSFKPFVYAAALDGGLTPASIILDGPFCVNPGRAGQYCFRNFSGGYAGPQTMRWGLEQSRNLMTIRAANQVGMERVNRVAELMGLGENYPNVLPVALGAADTTAQRITNAYAIMANQGRALTPTVIDLVQDRRGRAIFRADTRPCEGCNAPDWDGRPMPRPPLRTRQVMDPMTAYQVVHMLEGVVQRGTATVLRDLNRPIFGKTGTTTGPTNVWFVGGSAQIVAGVYLGYDRPRPMGGWAQGGRVAAPIFRQFARTAFEGMPVLPFRAPQGIRMVPIDRRTGRRAPVWPGTDPRAAVIWEAFRPESEPRRTATREEIAQAPRQTVRRTQARTDRRDSDFLQSQGGIY